MDPFSKNTPLMKESVKKIGKLKKKPRLIIDDGDDGVDGVDDGTKKDAITEAVKATTIPDRDTHGVFSEAKAFDVLDIRKKTTTKREAEKEAISKEKITYNNTNTVFNLDTVLNKDFDKLQSTLDKLPRDSPKISIYNVCYTIYYDAKIPYLLYYLFKYPKSDSSSSDLMIFPFKSYKAGTGKNIKTQSLELVDSLFSRTNRENINKDDIGYIYNKERKSIFVFYLFNSSKELFEPKFMNRKQQFWWCLVDELVNYKKILNFPVSSIVSNLLLENPSLIQLYYKNKVLSDDGSGDGSGIGRSDGEKIELLETPSVGYHGSYYDLIPLIVSFGLRPSTLYPMMGPYYYFGTFRKAVRYAGWTSTYKPRKIGDNFIADDNGLYNKGGIVRFALFLGKMKAFLNLPRDVDDLSDRYYNRIKLNPRDKKYEDMTLKLHDHDGKWAETYDSAYIGRARLTNGGLFMKNPEFIVRDFSQQNILTYHELDKDTLVYDKRRNKLKWDPNFNNYHIK